MTEEGVQELGETGFTSRQPEQNGINLRDIDDKIESLVEEGLAEKEGDSYIFDAGEGT
ncbi:hypothetical protein HRED_09312 [Candidatus Haloredivivus sp. G17]|nr:hypothetical protein HRED_09312 [Candidatus Haloredivivus sp. G17]